ncbi:MAG: DUF2239 family protein [Terracidiphilus sp.]|jgi:hypothetical protein
MDTNLTYSAFSGTTRLITGNLESVLREVKRFHDAPTEAADAGAILVFCDQQGQQVDFDLRGSIEDVLRKALPTPVRVGPGRPKLGVVSREITLLPRHWQWLESQPNGASAAVRRLVEEARKINHSEQPSRAQIEAVGRVMTVLAGNFPGFEEACRALYRRDLDRLNQCIEAWPPDVRSYILEHLTPDQNAEDPA